MLGHEVPAGVPVIKHFQLPDALEAEMAISREHLLDAVIATGPTLTFGGHWHQRLTHDLVTGPHDNISTIVHVLDMDDTPTQQRRRARHGDLAGLAVLSRPSTTEGERMIRSRTLAVLLAALALPVLAGCAPEVTPQAPADTEKTVAESTDNHDVTIEKIVGNAEPDNVSVLCVDGSAFLYVERAALSYNSGSSLARFSEQDEICSPAETPAPTPAP